MDTTYRVGSIVVLVLGLALASSLTHAGPLLAGGGSAIQSSVSTAKIVEQAVVVVGRRAVVVRRPVARCIWIAGMRADILDRQHLCRNETNVIYAVAIKPTP